MYKIIIVESNGEIHRHSADSVVVISRSPDDTALRAIAYGGNNFDNDEYEGILYNVVQKQKEGV